MADYISDMLYSSKLKSAMSKLSPSERELLECVFFKVNKDYEINKTLETL